MTKRCTIQCCHCTTLLQYGRGSWRLGTLDVNLHAMVLKDLKELKVTNLKFFFFFDYINLNS